MPFTRGHALIIGVGTYKHEHRLNVAATAVDAQQLHELLCDQNYCGYPVGQTYLLSHAQASRNGIINALKELSQRTEPEDTLLLFYSGHGGYSSDSTYQLTTHDTRMEGDSVVAGTALSQPELLQLLRLIPAKRLIMIINACHAGKISTVLGDTKPPFLGKPLPAQTADALLATGDGRIIITSSREGQISYVGSGEITIFTQALLDGLRGRGFSARGGYISAFDLYTHIYFAVREAVEKQVSVQLRQFYKDQEPELTVLKGVGPFAVALYRGATTLGDFSSDHTPAESAVVRQVEPEYSRWLFEQSISAADGVAIGGSVYDSAIVTGDNNTVIRSGRDTIQTQGDNIQTGHVSGIGIAIGREAQAIVNQSTPSHDPFERAFEQIYTAIRNRPEDQNVGKDELHRIVKDIQQESQKGEQANQTKLYRWLKSLADLAEDVFVTSAQVLSGVHTAAARLLHNLATQIRHERG